MDTNIGSTTMQSNISTTGGAGTSGGVGTTGGAGESTSSSNNNNRTLVPGARHGLNQLKLETASEIGIQNYESEDKGNLTSRQNGYVGGNMVRKMIADYENKLK